jgi:small subunit ribosomal protein S16
VAAKIRLKRIGKTRTPHYRIVVADSKTHRDGRVIEEIGRYVPTTDPSIIEVDSTRAQYWLSVGAQPTEPVVAILRLTGDLANEKGEKKNSVKPQVAKQAFSVDTAKKSVLLPKEEKKAKVEETKSEPAAEVSEPVVTEEVAAEPAAEAPAEAAEPAAEPVAEVAAEEASEEPKSE